MSIGLVSLQLTRRRQILLLLLSVVCLTLVTVLPHRDGTKNSLEHLLDTPLQKYQAKRGGEIEGFSDDTESEADLSHGESGQGGLQGLIVRMKAGDDRVDDDDDMQPVATVGVKMADHSQRGFDAERVFNLFCSCRKDGDIILIDCYIDAYEELCKLFRLFGTVFGFVTSDVEEKIGVLRDYRKSETASHYETIQSMLDFEVENNLTKSKKKPSGSRTLLRLHRALEFISALLGKLKDSDNKVKFSSQVCNAYDTTLAKHHPWLVKKAVHVALYMLPTRADLLVKMGVPDNEKGIKGISDLAAELNTIFEITEELYAKHNLLDLP